MHNQLTLQGDQPTVQGSLGSPAGIVPARDLEDQDGDLRPDVLDTITGLITTAIWFGITTGHFTLAGGKYSIPRRSAGSR